MSTISYSTLLSSFVSGDHTNTYTVCTSKKTSNKLPVLSMH